MPTDKERAEAAQVLAEPTEPAPQVSLPVAAILSPDGKPGVRLNPDYLAWSTKQLRKLVAVAVLLGIDAKENVAEMNWHAVALGLAAKYHPSFQTKKRRGRTRTKYAEARFSARADLLKLVDSHLDRLVGRKSVEAILRTLKKDAALPLVFQKMPKNTLRQEISIAKKERKERQKFMADLLRPQTKPTDYSQFLYVPGRDFVPSPFLFGLRLAKPMENSD